MIELPYLPPPIPGGHADYSGRFIAVGVLLLLSTLMFGCFTAAVPATLVLQHRLQVSTARYGATGNAAIPLAPPPTISYRQVIAGGLVYAALTVATAWLAIGAFLKRRWVRPMVLTFSVHALLLGGASLATTAVVLPATFGRFNASSRHGSWIGIITFVLTLTVSVGVFLGLPLVVLLLMRSEGVRLTAENYDLRSRWTDGLPVKVVGLIGTLVLVSVVQLASLAHPMVPMLNVLLTGPLAAGLIVLDVAVCVWAALLVKRRDRRAWPVAYVGLGVPLLLLLFAAPLVPMDRYYQALGTPQASQQLLLGYQTGIRVVLVGVAIFFSALFALYMQRIRPLMAVHGDAPLTAHTQ